MWFPTGWPSTFKPNDPTKPHCKSLPHYKFSEETLTQHGPPSLRETTHCCQCQASWPPFRVLDIIPSCTCWPLAWCSCSLLPATAPFCSFCCAFLWVHDCNFHECNRAFVGLPTFWKLEQTPEVFALLYFCKKTKPKWGATGTNWDDVVTKLSCVLNQRFLTGNVFLCKCVLIREAVWPHTLRMLLNFKNSGVSDDF